MAQVMGCACSSCGIEGRGMCAKFWSGNLKKRDCLEDLVINGSIILKWILKK